MRKADRGAKILQHNMSPGNFLTIFLDRCTVRTHNVGRGYVYVCDTSVVCVTVGLNLLSLLRNLPVD